MVNKFGFGRWKSLCGKDVKGVDFFGLVKWNEINGFIFNVLI